LVATAEPKPKPDLIAPTIRRAPARAKTPRNYQTQEAKQPTGLPGDARETPPSV
jgi:hypothetical protein